MYWKQKWNETIFLLWRVALLKFQHIWSHKVKLCFNMCLNIQFSQLCIKRNSFFVLFLGDYRLKATVSCTALICSALQRMNEKTTKPTTTTATATATIKLRVRGRMRRANTSPPVDSSISLIVFSEDETFFVFAAINLYAASDSGTCSGESRVVKLHLWRSLHTFSF